MNYGWTLVRSVFSYCYCLSQSIKLTDTRRHIHEYQAKHKPIMYIQNIYFCERQTCDIMLSDDKNNHSNNAIARIHVNFVHVGLSIEYNARKHSIELLQYKTYKTRFCKAWAALAKDKLNEKMKQFSSICPTQRENSGIIRCVYQNAIVTFSRLPCVSLLELTQSKRSGTYDGHENSHDWNL